MRGPWDWGAEKPKARRERLERGVAGFIAPGSQVTHVFAASRGARPGLEFLWLLFAPLSSTWIGTRDVVASITLAGLAGGALILAFEVFRRRYVIATSDDEALVFRSGYLHQLDAKRLEARMPIEGAVALHDSRRGRVYVGGTRYWVIGSDIREATTAAGESSHAPF